MLPPTSAWTDAIPPMLTFELPRLLREAISGLTCLLVWQSNIPPTLALACACTMPSAGGDACRRRIVSAVEADTPAGVRSPPDPDIKA